MRNTMQNKFLNLLRNKLVRGVDFDTDKRIIDIFPLGGIEFNQTDRGDHGSFDEIISFIISEDIVNFEILGQYNSKELEDFLKQYKYPILQKFKTEKILGNIEGLKASVTNKAVLRCKGGIYGRELLNSLFMQAEIKGRGINSIIHRLGDDIGKQTNWNTAYSGEVTLAYEMSDFNPISEIILGFLHKLSWEYKFSIRRFRYFDNRITITLSRFSNLQKSSFEGDFEDQIYTYKILEEGILINGVLWDIKNNTTLASKVFKLICIYFYKTPGRKIVELHELQELQKSSNISLLEDFQFKSENFRKNYIVAINELFKKSYKGELLDIKGTTLELKDIRKYPRIYPMEN